MKKIIRKILSVIKKHPYFFVFFFFLYFLGDIYINESYVILPGFFHYPLKIVIPYIITHILVPLLFAINILLVIKKFQELQKVSSATGVSLVGSFVGLLSGACPGCVAGLFPVIMGMMGYATFSLNSLPLYGTELQIISIILLFIGMLLLAYEPVCKVVVKK